MPKTKRAIAAIAGLHRYRRFINKHTYSLQGLTPVVESPKILDQKV
jgi:hypothetical protein